MIQEQFSQTLAYLYSLLPMYQRDGSVAFKKGLENTEKLCWELGLPQWQFHSIHVGGTNGKGSVSSMLNSVLMESGYKTGLYTSPHLQSFTERIRINGKEISQRKVVDFVEKRRHLIETISPSFFEFTVAMAFHFFAEAEVDIAVIEVGLGGRLDSTNIIKPEMSVITNISYDHQAMLGDTLGQIAGEKAGIIKKYTPVVIGERHPETDSVFVEKAALEGAPLFFAQDTIKVTEAIPNLKGQEIRGVISREEEQEEFAYQIDQRGNYQTKNLITTLKAIDVMIEDGWEIDAKAIKKGLAKTATNSGLSGRMQKLSQKPLIFCDTAHNEAGVKDVLEQLTRIPHDQLHIVWGMVNDKDHDKILALLPKNAKYYFVKPDVPRGLDAGKLAEKAAIYQLKGEIFNSVADGLIAAHQNAVVSENDLVYVGGSTFVVAEVVGKNEAAAV
ncbi:MAG: folylpolyglutamate synthase/dihydrofolate synthase family protein [Bacteroidia bacterium]